MIFDFEFQHDRFAMKFNDSIERKLFDLTDDYGKISTFIEALNIIIYSFNFLFVGALIYLLWRLTINLAEIIYEKEYLFSTKRIHFTNLNDSNILN